MALQHQIGLLTGSVSSPGIIVTVWDDAQADVEVDEARDHAINVAPNNIFGCLRTQDPQFTQLNNHAWRFTVLYKPQHLSTPAAPPREVGTLARRVNFQAKPTFLRTCLEPIGVYTEYGDETDYFTNTKWMVNVQETGDGQSRIEGSMFDPLPETDTLDYYMPNSEVSDSFVNKLRSLCGKFNSEPFLDNPQGSVQLVRASLSERSANDWELSLGFGFEAPRENISIGDLTIPELRGSWSYWPWVKHEVIELDFGNVIAPKPWLVVVQRVWPEADLNSLGLPRATYPEGE